MKRNIILVITLSTVLTAIAGTHIMNYRNSVVSNKVNANNAAYEDACMAINGLDIEVDMAMQTAAENGEKFNYELYTEQISDLKDMATASYVSGTMVNDFDNLMNEMDKIQNSLD